MEYSTRSALSILFIGVLALGLGGLWLARRSSERPENLVPALAHRYLDLIGQGDYARAYALLSDSSKAQCPMEDYRVSSGAPWPWSDLKLLKLEPDVALFAYTRRRGRAVERLPLFLLFESSVRSASTNWNLLEDPYGTKEADKRISVLSRTPGRWGVAYDEVILDGARRSLQEANADLALIQASAAATVNPRDPAARELVCAAARARRDEALASRECALAERLRADYPAP